MKTYIFDSINRYKRYSENLDVKATLCNKSWWLFNDEGTKSLYIFQENGDLYITTNGVGIKGTWQYISANKSVIINSENKILMFKPAFIDNNILTLTLDGTNNCAFLIEEQNKAHFAPRSLSDLSSYFEGKEKREIEEQKRLERERAARERERRLREEKEREYENSKEYKEKQIKKEAQDLRAQIIDSVDADNAGIQIFYLLLLIVPFLFIPTKYVWICPVGLILWFIFAFFLASYLSSLQDKRIERWKKEHPHDPRSKYL